MNSKNSRTSDPHRLSLNLTNQINLKRSDKYVAPSNRNMYYTRKKSYKSNKLKYQLQHGMKNLNYLIDHIIYQIFKIILNISLKKHREIINDDNPSIKIYVNQIENRISFKIKTGYSVELLTP